MSGGIADLTDEELKQSKFNAYLDSVAGNYVLPCTITGTKFMDIDFPAPKWVVDQLIPEGVSLLSGPPKAGKSILCTALAYAVSCGGYFLGKFPCEEGRVLYIASEDSGREVQARLRRLNATGNDNLLLITDCVDIVAAIAAAKRKYPDLRLIIIDTLQKNRHSQSVNNETLYSSEYRELSSIKDIADRADVSLLLSHHTNKRGRVDDIYDLISGSHVLSGVVDTNLILRRKRGDSSGKLYVDGREVPAHDLALQFDKDLGTWAYYGNAEDIQPTGARQEIFNLLIVEDKPMGLKEISEKLNKNKSTIATLVTKMVEDGHVFKVGYGQYTVSNEDATVDAIETVATVASSDRIQRRNIEDATDAIVSTDATDAIDSTNNTLSEVKNDFSIY